MATVVEVEMLAGAAARCEVVGGSPRTMTGGRRQFMINGADLTIQRESTGGIKINARNNALVVSVDSAKDKRVNPGTSLTMTNKQRHAVVRELV